MTEATTAQINARIAHIRLVYGDADQDAALLEALLKDRGRVTALEDALRNLLARDERNTCPHENTHRGGIIWEICDDCGAQWADDRGGKPDWTDPPEWSAARAALAASQPASQFVTILPQDQFDAFAAAVEKAEGQPAQPVAAGIDMMQSLSQSRDHFKGRAEANKARVKRLRHRQRALVSALELVVKSESLSDAKQAASLALGAWEDETLIHTARTAPQPLTVQDAQPAAVKVKPLVWERHHCGCFTIKSKKPADNGCDVVYYAERANPSGHVVSTVTKPGYSRCAIENWIGAGSEFVDIEAAKAAAQADYEARIMAALDVQPLTVQDAARHILSDDIAISHMAQALHDGPLGADDYWFSAARPQGAWCVDAVRVVLRAIAEGLA